MISVYSGRPVHKGLKLARLKHLKYLGPGNKKGQSGFYFKTAQKTMLFFSYAQVDKLLS